MTFNREAAEKAYDLVMKMDAYEARIFTTMVVTDVLHDTMDNNHKALQRHLDEVLSKRIHKIKHAISKAYMKHGEQGEILAAAGAVALIEKADADDWYKESEHPRGAGGRFRTTVNGNLGTSPLNSKQQDALNIPKAYKGRATNKELRLDDESKARYHNEYMQIGQFLRAAAQSGVDTSKAKLEVQNIATGDVHYAQAEHNGKPSTHSWDPDVERVVGVSAPPNQDLSYGGASFGLVSALGGSPATGDVAGNYVTSADRALPTLANDWYNEKDVSSSNSQLYGRVHAGSKFVGMVAPNGSHAQVAAKFGEFVGSHGHEAEKVFGPPTRKAMYRYRGTERKPSENLTQMIDQNVRRSDHFGSMTEKDLSRFKAIETRETNRLVGQRATNEGKPIEALSPSRDERKAGRQKAIEAFQVKRETSAIETRDSTRMASIAYLNRRLPKGELNDLPSASIITPSDGGVCPLFS